MRRLSVTLTLCLSMLLQGCLPHYYIKDKRVQTPPPRESDFWWGVAVTGTGAAMALGAYSNDRDQFGVGVAIGGLIVLLGLDRFAKYYSAKFWYPRLKEETSTDQAPVKNRNEELRMARIAETEGRWAHAWGAYRRAKDLGPASQVIEDKLVEMEGKLAAEREKLRNTP